MRTEIIEAQEQYGNDIPYDALVALPYLDAFCRETMRMYVSVFSWSDRTLTIYITVLKLSSCRADHARVSTSLVIPSSLPEFILLPGPRGIL